MRKIVFSVVFAGLVTLLGSCGGDSYTPKPRAYYRIDLPEPAYQRFDTSYPYAFDYSRYAEIIPRTDESAEPYWINVYYPAWNATLHVSYKPVQGDLDQLLEDARFFTTKQIPKADELVETDICDTVSQVYGKIYEFTGMHVACTYQFWLTDREKHFFRAALYFHTVPNNDSLAPVQQYICRDMERLIKSFAWK